MTKANTKANMNALAQALREYAPSSKSLNVEKLSLSNEAEIHLAKIIAEETEAARETERPKRGKTIRGLLGNEIDAADLVEWDEFLQDIEVLQRCARRANIAQAAVLHFAIHKCSPSNWRALFWMHAWFKEVYRRTREDYSDAMAELEELHAKKQTEESRAKAKAMAEARHGKPGGARDKQSAIRAAWASGKYSSRALCAEQECGALGMSFDTARRTLRNTPNPARE